MADNYTIYKFFTSKVDFKSKTKEVEAYISNFFTENIETLTSDGFSKRMVFGASRKTSLLSIYGIDPKEWNLIVKAHPILQIGENVKDLSNQLLIMHYIMTENRLILKFLAVKLFTSKYYRSFPMYIKEAKMKAVIDSLSNKFYIKKHGTLDKALDATVNTYVTTYGDRFHRANDDDIIYVINALSTRVGILVRNVQVKYYNAPDDIGFFEDREVMEKEGKRVTTNDTVVFDNIITTVKSKELSYSFDLAVLRQVKGYEFKEVMKDIYKNNRNEISDIIQEIMYDYLKNNNTPSLQKAHDEFLKWSFNNRNRGVKLLKLIETLTTTHSIEKKDLFKDVIIKYYSIKLYKELLREVV